METLLPTTYTVAGAIITSPTTTSVKGTKTVEGSDGKYLDIDVFKSTTAGTAAITTTAAPTYQDWSYQQQVQALQEQSSIIETADESELSNALKILDEKGADLTLMFDDPQKNQQLPKTYKKL